MSAELALDELDLEQLFDERGELRLVEEETGWAGYVLEDGDFYFVDNRGSRDRKLRVGEKAVRLAVGERADHVLELAGRIRRAAP